jgi:nucleotide-binding universal stress UspA family protein
VYVAPGTKKRALCFLVYYDGDTASTAALNSALDLMEPNTVIIALACAPTSPRAATSNPMLHATSALAHAARSAAQRGVAIRTELLECDDLGPALVEHASVYGADIIFWGVARAEVESGLNPAAEYILKFAPSKVVLVGT